MRDAGLGSSRNLIAAGRMPWAVRALGSGICPQIRRRLVLTDAFLEFRPIYDRGSS